ncbi:MAG TPA: hemolysin family protein [Caulobacteraceae bacterium]|jgi:CBS domain containing-hemolysin-like protein
MSETDSERLPEARRPSLLERLGLRRPAKPGPAEIAAAVMVDHARAFQNLTVEDVMIPRADITAIELAAPFAELIAVFAESEHTRLPVYRESLDDPIGFVHLKDVFHLIAEPTERAAAGAEPLRKIKRDTLYVPPSMRAAELLPRMQSTRTHMAMVIDEFGGLDGLVTLEDLLEGVVGEIDDEHDEAQHAQIVARAGGVFEIDGRAPLEELEAALKTGLVTEDMDDEGIETAGGMVAALAGRLPQRGEVIVHPAGFDFEITDADPRHINRLRARPRTAGG